MLTIDPKEIPVGKLHGYLQSAVIPRPIAFASTVDKDGRVNVSPFSFFNVFSTNPAVLVFSPSRRGRDNTTKHTYENVKEVPEVVISIVNYNMVQQVSLASSEYGKGVNEYIKAGLTEVPSVRVRPPRPAESPVAFECRVNQIIELGTQGAAGNLVICEVLLMHIKEEVLDELGRIDPLKLDAVARMGGDHYLRMSKDTVFTVPKPNEKRGMGFDRLPSPVRTSSVLTGNDLGILANCETLPSPAEAEAFRLMPGIAEILRQGMEKTHRHAQQLLREGKTADAWKLLLMSDE